MTKRINEIFYSLQGEGRNTGRPAVFIRFAGCNLRCPFCDTEFTAYREMTDGDILREIAPYPARLVILTGGEPTLQADEALIERLHACGYSVAMETNGTHQPPPGVDWLTVSPKAGYLPGQPKARPVVRQCDELKCVFDGLTPVDDFGINAKHYLLQPCDTGDEARNRQITEQCVAYILSHPRWQLSLQTHKLIGVR